MHKEDPPLPLEETLTALDSLVRAGKVRYLGFSNWSAWKTASALELQKAQRPGALTRPDALLVAGAGRRARRDPDDAPVRGGADGGGASLSSRVPQR